MITRIEPFGALTYNKEKAVTIRFNQEEARKLLGFKGKFPTDLSAPEIVHLEISNRCNLNCKYCYVKDKSKSYFKDRFSHNELRTNQWKSIIHVLADNKVFQITFGGGEPFMRDDIFELAKFADSLGMNVGVTTNGSRFHNFPTELKVFKQVNISYHKSSNINKFKNACHTALPHTNVGINFIVRNDNIYDIAHVAHFAKENDIEILLLTYKPVDGDIENRIEPKKVFELGRRLSEIGIKIAVDGLTCGNCGASERFVDISSSGEVFACSFIRESMGNCLDRDFKEIWKNRNIPKRCPYGKIKI